MSSKETDEKFDDKQDPKLTKEKLIAKAENLKHKNIELEMKPNETNIKIPMTLVEEVDDDEEEKV